MKYKSKKSKDQLIIPPDGGWEENTYYKVESAFSDANPIHGYLFFSGFLDDGRPGGYSGFADTDPEERYGIEDVVYLKVLEKITIKDHIEDVPNKYKMKSEVVPTSHRPRRMPELLVIEQTNA